MKADSMSIDFCMSIMTPFVQETTQVYICPFKTHIATTYNLGSEENTNMGQKTQITAESKTLRL